MIETKGTIWLPNVQMATAYPPLEVVSTDKQTIVLANGKTLVDGLASWWTACHGYNEPTIIHAIQSQAQNMPHIMLGGLVHKPASQLAERLSKMLPGDLNHVFFSDSGAVSVEVAMKMALQFWQNQKQSQRNRFIYFQNGYHGDTLYTTSVCSPNDAMYEKFAHVLPSQFCLEIPQTPQALENFEKCLAQHANHLAAIIIEPLVQGAGGMHLHSPDVLAHIYRLAKQYDLLLIADEIFTGFGRTGSLFAVAQADIVPDIICLSKALTGGTLPLAVTVANKLVYDAFLSDSPEKAFLHSSTYMGNPLACAAAHASLDIFAQNTWQEKVAKIEQILQTELSCLRMNPGVKDVRVLGAIGAIELNIPLGKDLNWFKARTVEEGIWLRPLPSSGVIYTTPAFTIETDELLKITHVLNKLITEWSKQYFA